MFIPKVLVSVNRSIPVGQRRAYIERIDGQSYLKTDILPGDFLLADGCFSASTVYQQERGVFIGADDKYIELSSISDGTFTRSEVFEWCKANGAVLPDIADLQRIDVLAAAAINNSLRQIGLEKSVFTKDAASEFWSKESLENQQGITERRILLIKQVIGLNKTEFPRLDGPIGICKAFLPDVIWVRQSFADSFWILQQIAPDYFYILESQVHNSPEQCKNIDNGNIHLEGASLVVENPVGEVYTENGSQFITTHKDYFRRVNCSLYTKVGENYDRWTVQNTKQ